MGPVQLSTGTGTSTGTRSRRLPMTSPITLLAVVGLLLALGLVRVGGDELWERDVTDEMGIGVATSGYRQVSLRCGADYMQVELELEEDFDGVIYSRGNFYDREEPCFLDANLGRNFTLRLPFDQCNTKNVDGIYSNIVVVQYDNELIMPGDAAFKLECDFSKDKKYIVQADLANERSPVLSRITLQDADPAAKEAPKNQQLSASSKSANVIFTPGDIKTPARDEL